MIWRSIIVNKSIKVFLLFLLLPIQVTADTLPGDVLVIPESSKMPIDYFGILNNYVPEFTLVFVCVIYVGLLMFGRYNWIVQINCRYLRAYSEEINAQLTIEQEEPARETKTENKIISAITKILDKVNEIIPEDPTWHKWLFSGTGKQLACWRHAHQAKIFAVDLYSESDACSEAIIVHKKLASLKSDISEDLTAEFTKLTNGISLITPPSNLNIPMIKSLTKRGLELYFDERDNHFEGLANLQNRVTWLVFISIILVMILGFSSGHSILFLFGAIGGLLSRMRTILVSKDKAFDYGASWSSLFLTPVVGAITGWIGILLTVALLDLGILGPVIDNMFFDINKSTPWEDIEITKQVMALAVAFGFSATLFENIIKKIEESVVTDKGKNASGKNQI